MASTSPGYGITIRVEGSPDIQPVALATTVITGAGATITALDVVESLLEKVVIDITCDTIDASHAEEITAAISAHSVATRSRSIGDSLSLPLRQFCRAVSGLMAQLIASFSHIHNRKRCCRHT